MEKTIYLNDLAMNIAGNLPENGTDAPEFLLAAQDLSDIRLSDFKGRRVVLNIFPSLDTEVCAMSVRKFNELAAGYPNTTVICISEDLPFAAARFCAANGIKNVITGSTFRSTFGSDYGVEILNGPMRGLMARVVIVIDENGKVAGQWVCDQITDEPNYDAAIALLQK